MTRRTGTRHGGIIGVIGRSRSGKGVWIKRYFLPKVRGPILVWSPLEISRPDDYAGEIGGERVYTIQELVKALAAGKTRLVFVPSQDDAEREAQFDRFCRILENPGFKRWTVIVEELMLVTKPHKAPTAWKSMTTAGAHSREMTLIGVSQRPAQVDKDFLGNCTEIHCYAVSNVADAKVMADVLFVDKAEILGLQKFHYIHRDAEKGEVTTGVVSYE
ncbi:MULTISPECIES: hypothetical protein [Burkholderia]|uniref:Zona occludens toxin N-terminal domain-containing protein n=1 Tax=Burkholderia cepacia TaxID=292 RepID=A0A103ZUG2_BURCE|nr:MULTISPECIES: hypothetical protein [Burkholderia]KVK86199.1 hypothetical protein WS90_07975 [Burkholderia cepacia]MBN3833154.1 hypothetical protein [Burkholderia sp. Ac-20344]MDN7873844.1 hypothetical protein [Burkholderia aenigmatica]RQS84085.1 hypothetical protein DF032_03095 [Burkholderia seminalis]RQT41932.1 hypothetical protein DF135_02525 [Burkholderia cepacia]